MEELSLLNIIEKDLSINEKELPLPLEKRLMSNEVTEHRFFNCEHYDKCLSKAAYAMWESFTCKLCDTFKGGKNAR